MVGVLWFWRHQRSLRVRAHLMQEAIRNHDFTFRLPTNGLLPGERAMQETLNQLGDTIRQQVNQSEVESWERLTRVLTHEIMNATAPIASISQSLLGRPDVKGYSDMTWDSAVGDDVMVCADPNMLRQILINLVKNAIEAGARRIGIQNHGPAPLILVSNDGQPIPAEARKSIFVPFFTTKRTGSGIGLSLSRRMMIQQGGSLSLLDQPQSGYHTTFALEFQKQQR